MNGSAMKIKEKALIDDEFQGENKNRKYMNDDVLCYYLRKCNQNLEHTVKCSHKVLIEFQIALYSVYNRQVTN